MCSSYCVLSDSTMEQLNKGTSSTISQRCASQLPQEQNLWFSLCWWLSLQLDQGRPDPLIFRAHCRKWHFSHRAFLKKTSHPFPPNSRQHWSPKKSKKKKLLCQLAKRSFRRIYIREILRLHSLSHTSSLLLLSICYVWPHCWICSTSALLDSRKAIIII